MLQARASELVKGSLVLRPLLADILLARGRLYLRREPDDIMARITPLDSEVMLLESPRGSNWTEHKRGPLATVLKVVEGDTAGTFHGLGCLVSAQSPGNPAPQLILFRDFGIPVEVLAEPRDWYSRHRQPEIVEASDSKDLLLVRFVHDGFASPIEGTCLYARREALWGCYTIKPSAAGSISTAQAWLEKRKWKDWG